MAAPYIAIDLDAKKRIPPAARLAQIPECQFGWGLVSLWEWCWQSNSDRVTPDHLEAFMGADGARVVRALVAFGFAEELENGEIRVKGADRYLRISEAKSRAGKARAASAKRDEKGQMLGQHVQQTAQQESSRPPAGDQQATSGGPALSPTTDDRRPTTEHQQKKPAAAPPAENTEAFGWMAWAESQRRKALPNALPSVPGDSGRFLVWWREVRGLVEVERLKAAYLAFLNDPWARTKCNPPCPWEAWASRWSRYVPGQGNAAPAQEIREVKPGEDPYAEGAA